MVQPEESSSMIVVFSSVRSRWWDRQDTAVVVFREDDIQQSRRKVILARIGNQCRSLRAEVMCYLWHNPVTTRARVFWTRCRLSRLDSGICRRVVHFNSKARNWLQRMRRFRGICWRSRTNVSQPTVVEITCTTDVVNMFLSNERCESNFTYRRFTLSVFSKRNLHIHDSNRRRLL